MEANSQSMKSFALAMTTIVAAQFKLESMKIANLERESQGKAFAYDESAFLNAQQELIGDVRNHCDWI